MEKLESLTLEDTPRVLTDLPVEILRCIIEQVVLSTGFYAALELRLVNKLFDVIALDSVLDTDRDSHIDTGYLDVTYDLAYTALDRRVVDSATRSPPLVSKIRSLTAKLHAYEPSLPIHVIRKTLCWTSIVGSGSTAIFNWRKGVHYSSINDKHEKLNRELKKIGVDEEDEGWMDWYLCLIYTYNPEFDNLKRVYEKAKEMGKPVNLDYKNPVFGNILVVAARYATEEIAIWLYDHSTICKPEGSARDDFLHQATRHGQFQVVGHLAREEGVREEKYFAFSECPRWATSANQNGLLKWLLSDEWMVCEDVSKEAKYVFLAACTHGNLEIAKWIVECGFQPEVGEKTKSLRPRRPLCQATQSGNVELVAWLLGIPGIGEKEEMLLSFKWATRYAGLDMVKLYFERGLPIDVNSNDWIGGKVVKAAIDAARKGRAKHLRWLMENGVVFKAEDAHAVVYKTAQGGNFNCLKVLRDLLDDYEAIAKTQLQIGWDNKDRRAVETLLKDGLEKPSGFSQDALNSWKYGLRFVSMFGFSRKKWGYWPYLWNYSTHF